MNSRQYKKLQQKKAKKREEEAYKRFLESIELARSVGVPENQILHNMEEAKRFFCG